LPRAGRVPYHFLAEEGHQTLPQSAIIPTGGLWPPFFIEGQAEPARRKNFAEAGPLTPPQFPAEAGSQPARNFPAAPATLRPFFSEALNGNDPLKEEIFKLLRKISLDNCLQTHYIDFK